MYGHQVIDDLKDSIKKVPNLPNYRTHMEMIVNAMMKAHHFHCGDLSFIWDVVEPMMKKGGFDLFNGENAVDINMPYPICWFDIRDDMSAQDAKDFQNAQVDKLEVAPGLSQVSAYPEKRGILVIDEGHGLLNVRTLSKLHGIDKWIVEPIQAIVTVGRSVYDLLYDPTVDDRLKKQIRSKKASDEELQKGSIIYYMIEDDHFKHQKANQIAMQESIQTALLYCNVFLMLLNAKNIITEGVQAPAKLNKKRVKKNKAPIFTYKTLHITLPKEYTKYENRPHQGGHKRIHFCRGHFRTYTADKPLFGKITGRFWVPNHVRGNKKAGIVAKDYTI